MYVNGHLSKTNSPIEAQSDPHLFLLAWKMRPRGFLEVYEDEWNVVWALERAFTIEAMKEAIERWREEVCVFLYGFSEYLPVKIKNSTCFTNFYNFTFDYLLLERGTNASVLSKEDSIRTWGSLNVGKNWGLYPQWVEYW